MRGVLLRPCEGALQSEVQAGAVGGSPACRDQGGDVSLVTWREFRPRMCSGVGVTFSLVQEAASWVGSLVE